MGEGSSHKVSVAAWGWWSCCDSTVVVLSGTLEGHAAHKYPCKHPQHPLTEQHCNLLLLLADVPWWQAGHPWDPASLWVCIGLEGTRTGAEQVGEGAGWEKELGATENRGTKLHPHLQSCSAFTSSHSSAWPSSHLNLPICSSATLLCPSSPSSWDPELSDTHLPLSSAVEPTNRSCFSSPCWVPGFPSLHNTPAHRPSTPTCGG